MARRLVAPAPTPGARGGPERPSPTRRARSTGGSRPCRTPPGLAGALAARPRHPALGGGPRAARCSTGSRTPSARCGCAAALGAPRGRQPRTRPVAVYVGDRLLPRHVVLVDGRRRRPARTYEPASGRGRRRVDRDALGARWPARPCRLGPAVAGRQPGDERGVARLDHLVDDREPLVEGQERRLHRVDGEPAQVARACSRTPRPGRTSPRSSRCRSSAGCRC